MPEKTEKTLPMPSLLNQRPLSETQPFPKKLMWKAIPR